MKPARHQIISSNLGTNLERILLWNVYTDADFQLKQNQPSLHSRNTGDDMFIDIFIYKICYVCLTILQIHINVSVLNTTTFITGSIQMYNRHFETNITSVINQLAILTNDLPAEYKCLVVHTLKSQANPNNPKHRYSFL